MKIKQIVVAASMLGGWIGLKAGILPEWVRALNSYEQSILQDPMDVQRRLCYIEVRQICSQGTTAQDHSDIILQEFSSSKNSSSKKFDAFCEKDLSDLLTEVAPNIGNPRVTDYIALWFIRKRIDEGCDVSQYPGDMQTNMWYFWQCCPVLIETIKAAIALGGVAQDKFNALIPTEQHPAPEGHERDYLDYPECFAALLPPSDP